MEELSREGRAGLLRLARASIRSAVCRDDSLRRALDAMPITQELERQRGAFITLKTRPTGPGVAGALRGCIGCVTATRPLYRTVIDFAPKAALEDPRFSPLAPEELPGLQLEVSVLGPLRDIDGPGDVKIGRDGVQLSRDLMTAVFLPQVARERRWDVGKLLEQLSLKAGLAADGWNGARLRTFEAEVFGESATTDDESATL